MVRSKKAKQPAVKKGGAAKRSGARRATNRGTNIGTYGIAAFLLTVAVLVGSGVVLSQLLQVRTDALQARLVDAASNGHAQRLGALLTQPMATLRALAGDPRVATALAAGDARALRALEAEITGMLPGVQRVRLLPPGVDRVDESTRPPLGFADLQTLRQAEQSGGFPPAEVILPGTEDAHYNLAYRVLAAGERLVGVVLATYPAGWVVQGVSDLPVGADGVELRQGGSVVLARRGATGQGEPAAQIGVPGSRWSLWYWAGVQAGGTDDLLLLYAAIGAAAAVVLAVLVYLLFRALSTAMRRDQITVLNLVKDILGRKLGPSYPVKLAASRVTVELLVNMGQEFVAQMPAAGRKSARQAEAVPNLSASALFFDSSAVSVEESEGAPSSASLEKVPGSIFRAYDVRGVVGKTLTEETAQTLGRAIGSEAFERGQQTVVVARDGRNSGKAMVEALTRGLLESGRDVIDIGMVPTPVLYFATQYLRTGSGVMVTGSHNPPEYNGFKMMLRDDTLSGDAIQALRMRIQTDNLLSGQGTRSAQSVLEDYLGRITGDVQVARPLKVVVDCGNGVAGAVAPQLLRGLGCEVTELFCEVDGSFPNHHPDPGKPENLRTLIAKVRETKAHLGVAFDGDGDRLGVVDEQGRILFPDRLLMLFARDLLLRHPGASVIYDVKCSRHLKGVIAQHAGQPMMWKTGHSFIKAAMKKTGALLAGEMSGHFFFKERWFGFDDGMYAAARLLEILGAQDQPASRVFAELPDSVSTPEITVPVEEGEQHELVDTLVEQAQFADAEIVSIDGVRADFADGFGLVRASNTTPNLVLRFEGDDEAALKRIQEAFRAQLLAVKSDLALPF